MKRPQRKNIFHAGSAQQFHKCSTLDLEGSNPVIYNPLGNISENSGFLQHLGFDFSEAFKASKAFFQYLVIQIAVLPAGKSDPYPIILHYARPELGCEEPWTPYRAPTMTLLLSHIQSVQYHHF